MSEEDPILTGNDAQTFVQAFVKTSVKTFVHSALGAFPCTQTSSVETTCFAVAVLLAGGTSASSSARRICVRQAARVLHSGQT